MNSTKNRKQIAGSAIFLTASAFMLALYGTFGRIPAIFVMLHVTACVTFAIFTILGQREIKSEQVEKIRTSQWSYLSFKTYFKFVRSF